MSSKTVFVDQHGKHAGEIGGVFFEIYEGLLVEVNGESVIVTSVDWEILEEATTCRIGIAPAPAELLAN
jgi:hypothetical protein